ncbi:hypothetical protein JYU34_014017 [Plutella xylostella]|uniref:Epidermal growth factor receptor substrate 15-like 1 n=1 Tax=Plutella xylostella TaxID=51655 RepID=A0ABQ7Q7F6_PLUXY|nr:hypothetical protein JYU34_014017 [Plutella xylostella]
MAALPSPTQVAGTHSAIYEAYFHQVDPNGTGAVQALDAARFLKKSRLSDVVLSKIWDLSDPTGKGYLDKAGLFVALKLVALAQAGRDINMSNIHADAPPPKVGDLPKIPSGPPPARPAAPSPAPASDWSIKPAEREKYSQLFDELQPNNGLIAGNKVKGVLMESKLPLETLGKIWDLADQDKDGMLDRHEFLVAMHLVYKALEKHHIPTTLPAELRRAPPRPASPRAPPVPAAPLISMASKPAPPPLIPMSAARPSPSPLPPSSAPLLPSLAQPTWVVTAAEKRQFDAMFEVADADKDGLVSGLEIKQTLLESGLPQATLAHIWALCDQESVGKLTRNQFALAMWLVQRARAGAPPPAALAPDMVPPKETSEPKPVEPVSLGPQPTPELEAIAREVDQLVRERAALEPELAARERELETQAAQEATLQSELDTLTATLKQLENQKGEANKRLADLKSQANKLRSQVSVQEAAAAETEAEVEARRAAAQSLKERERQLQDEAAAAAAEADALTQRLSRNVLAISQANIKITHLEEQLDTISAAAASLAEGAPSRAVLDLRPAFSRAHLQRLLRGATPSDQLEDSFESRNEFGAMNGSGFDSEPFPSAAPAHDPFAPSHASQSQDGFGSDPFSRGFPSDGADPFAGDAFAQQPAASGNEQSGEWEEDPFAVLHAPTRASPTPALPPKKHKVPPPRPAPPRPAPPHKTDSALDFTEDPFKDYRYEDPFNIADPFADVTDAKADPFARPTSVAGFETNDFFGLNGNGSAKPSGRVSAPPLPYDPFSNSTSTYKPSLASVSNNNNDSWSAWPNDSWATDDAWDKPTNKTTNNTSKPDAWSTTTQNKTDNWGSTDNWATDWSNTDNNKNLNETWPSNTLPNKKEKSPKPVKYAKSLVHTIGGIGRTKHNKKEKEKEKTKTSASGSELPTEEHQMAWAAAESKRLQAEAEDRRRREDAELQLALAISRQEK